MKFKKTFLIVLLSVSLIANSCMRSYAFIGIPSVAAGAVISILSSWGLTFVFNGQSFSDSVNYIGDLLDEWGGSIDFSSLGISTDGALVVGAAIYNGLRNFADWLIDKFSVSSEGAYVTSAPIEESELFSSVGLSSMTAPTLESFNTSGTLFTWQNTNGWTKGISLGNGWYLEFATIYDSSYASNMCVFGYKQALSGTVNSHYLWPSNANESAFWRSGIKFYFNTSQNRVNFYYLGLNGAFLTKTYHATSWRVAQLDLLYNDYFSEGISSSGGIAIDAQNVSIPDTDIDESNAGLFTLTNISALIGSYARDISSVMDDVINKALTVNNYNTVVNTGSVASTIAAADAVEAVEDIYIAVTDPLPPPSEDDMQLSLSSVFPFCLPFDLYNFFACLAADPVTPSFDVEIAGTELHADAHALDSYAPVFRKFILLGYVITLVVNTKKLLRGDS